MDLTFLDQGVRVSWVYEGVWLLVSRASFSLWRAAAMHVLDIGGV